MDFGATAGMEQPFRVLADQNDIDSGSPGVVQGNWQSGKCADRPNAGIQIEMEPEIELGNDFCPILASHMRQAHGSEQDGVGLFTGGKRRIGKRGSSIQIVLCAGPLVIEVEPDANA